MRILIDIGHPAHVHLFKNFIKAATDAGHEIIVTSRKKGVTTELLDHYNIDHKILSEERNGLLNKVWELFMRTLKIIKIHLNNNIDLALGTSSSIGFLTVLFGVPSYVFGESDDDVVPFFAWSAFPFATKIVQPKGMRYNKWKNKRVFHNSYHELAYLHPNVFSPNEKILDKYKLKPKEYIIIRNTSLKAHHDIGVSGLGKKVWERVYEFVKDYPLINI